MRDFALAPEFVELQAAAERLGRVELAPHVRDAERAGRWSDAVLAVLDGLPLGDLDLPERLGGVEAGSLAKVVTLETLAMADAGGLLGADRLGLSVGALLADCSSEMTFSSMSRLPKRISDDLAMYSS